MKKEETYVSPEILAKIAVSKSFSIPFGGSVLLEVRMATKHSSIGRLGSGGLFGKTSSAEATGYSSNPKYLEKCILRKMKLHNHKNALIKVKK